MMNVHVTEFITFEWISDKTLACPKQKISNYIRETELRYFPQKVTNLTNYFIKDIKRSFISKTLWRTCWFSTKNSTSACGVVLHTCQHLNKIAGPKLYAEEHIVKNQPT